MAVNSYDDHGVHFEYPSDWTVEVTEDDALTTVNLEHPEGVAFVIVTFDSSGPDPGEVADAILETLREEYPGLDEDPFEEVLNKHLVSGYEVQFFALDLPNTARIRSFRTIDRTILIYGQWADIVDAEVSDLADHIINAVEHSED